VRRSQPNQLKCGDSLAYFIHGSAISWALRN